MIKYSGVSRRYHDNYMNNDDERNHDYDHLLDNDLFHNSDDCGVTEPEEYSLKEKESKETKRKQMDQEIENFHREERESKDEEKAAIMVKKIEKREKKNDGGKPKIKKLKNNSAAINRDVSQNFQNSGNVDSVRLLSTERHELYSGDKNDEINDNKLKGKIDLKCEVVEDKNFEFSSIKISKNIEENFALEGKHSEFQNVESFSLQFIVINFIIFIS